MLHAAGHRASERIECAGRGTSDLDRPNRTSRHSRLIDGDVLTRIGACSLGPAFSNGILDEVYDAQLEGRVNSQDEAIAMALKIAGR